MTMEGSWKVLLDRLAAIGGHIDDPDRLSEFDRAVRDLVLYDDVLEPGKYLVHYTSWERGLAILTERDGPMLRMYNYERANDPQEGRLPRRVWGDLDDKARYFNRFLPAYEQVLLRSGRSTGSTFGCCFSAGDEGVEDNLTFWRLYGNDGDGCSFKVTGLPTAYRVRYLDEDGKNSVSADDDVDKTVASWLAILIATGRELVDESVVAGYKDAAIRIASGIRRILGGYSHLAKRSYFADEAEWRMVRVGPCTESVQYDVDESGVVKRYVSGLFLKDALVTAPRLRSVQECPTVVQLGPMLNNWFGTRS